MSEPNPHQVEKLFVELKLEKLLNESEDHPQVRVKSIHDLELLCGKKPEFIYKIIEALFNYLYTEKPVDYDAVQEVFMTMFHLDKRASLNAVLKEHSARLYPEKVPPPKDRPYIIRTPQMEIMELYKTNLLKRRIADLREKSLKNESKEELQQLAEVVEEQSGLDARNCKIEVSDTDRVDKFLSCLQMAVPLFARGAPSTKLLNYVNNLISLPDYDELSEQRKLDIFRALAEILSHTTAQKCIPQPEIKRIKSFTYVECLLYVLHHLALKAPDVATQVCNKELMSRFENVRSITRTRMKILAETLCKEDEEVLQAEKALNGEEVHMRHKFKVETKRQSTKAEIRSCSNILAITKLLERKESCFVKLSWKEARKAFLPSKLYSGCTYSRAPPRSAVLESIANVHNSELDETGICRPNDKQVKSLNVLSKFQQVSRNREGSWVLSDSAGIAMLFWHMKESGLSFLRHAGKQGRSGQVRDQLYHLLCWSYAASDIVSYERCLRKWENPEHVLPLCAWYLCAFCDPSKLGKDKRAQKPQDDDRIHHCYGADIELALLHIQENGVPRESVSNFICTDYQPPSADEPGMERRKIGRVRRVNTLEKVLQALENDHVVGADLLNYSGLVTCQHVYEAGISATSLFGGYHAVVIEEIKKMDNDWVAVCKLSNGNLYADWGCCYVSLTTQYIPVGVSDEKINTVRGSTEPMHLLTNFIIIELTAADENEEENWESDHKENWDSDDEEEDAKDDDKSSEKKSKGKRMEPEEKKYIPKSKQSRSSASVHSRNTLSVTQQVTESDALDDIEDAITRHKSISTTKVMASVALQKLSSRSPSNSERIKDIIVKQKGSLHLGKQQQGALEYSSVVNIHNTIRSSLVERIPVLDEATLNVRRAGSFPASASTVVEPSVSLPKPAVAPLAHLLLCVELGSPPSQCGATQATKTGTVLLLDILSIGTPLAQNCTPSIDLLSTHSEQDTLVPVVIWCIGEYGDLLVNSGISLTLGNMVTECDVEDVIEDAITRHNSDMSTKVMALVTPLKLSHRVPSISEFLKFNGWRIEDIIVKQKGSLHLEMLQTAILST